MIAHRCGTENAEHAKFCTGCGEQLSALAVAGATATGALSCSRCGQMHLPGARSCANCDADPGADKQPFSSSEPSSASREPVPECEKTVQWPAVGADGVVPVAAADNRLGRVVLIGAIVAAAVSGGAWGLMSGKADTPEAGGAAVVGTAAPVSPATPQPSASGAPGRGASTRDAASGANFAPAGVSHAVADRKGIDDQKAGQARRTGEQASTREAAAKRKSEAEEPRRMAQDQRAQQDTQSRAEAARRSSQQGALQQADLRTVKQICGDRPNAFSRSVCELRECARPAKADSADCVELRERNAPSTHGVIN